jgi:hypothetical protein
MNATLLIMLVAIAITISVAWHGRGRVLARPGYSPIKASERHRSYLLLPLSWSTIQPVSGQAIHCSLGLNLCTTRWGCIAVPKPMINRWTTVNGTSTTVAIASSSKASGLSYLTMR